MPNEYVALKGKFFTPKNGEIAGAFCIIYAGGSGKLLEKIFQASRVPEAPQINPRTKWEDFTSELNGIGAYDRALTEKVSESVLQALDHKLRADIFADANATEPLEEALKAALEKALHYSIDLEIAAELFDKARAEAGGVVRVESESQSGKSDEPDADGGIKLGQVVIACQPQIDPVNGCPASALGIGTVININIPETNDIAKKLAASFEEHGIEMKFPVESVQQSGGGRVSVVVRINDEIQGMMKVSGEMRIKADNITGHATHESHGIIDRTLILQISAIGGFLLLIAMLIHFIIELL